MSDLLDSALGYAARGWPVFLLGRSKRPVANCRPCREAGQEHDRTACGCLTCHGPYAATIDPDRIGAMFRAVPGGLLAIATGAVSGLVVVDVDPGHGGDIDRDRMVPTDYVRTGSGGLHLYYRHPGTPILNSQSRIGPGVDVRGEAGYVVAPPSIHPRTGRAYEWRVRRGAVEMPPALVAACAPRPAPGLAPPRPSGPSWPIRQQRGGGGISSPSALLTAHLTAVRNAPPGRRRTTLYGAARGIARMVAAGVLTHTDAWTQLTAAGRIAEQTERDIRNAINGGFKDEGVTL